MRMWAGVLVVVVVVGITITGNIGWAKTARNAGAAQHSSSRSPIVKVGSRYRFHLANDLDVNAIVTGQHDGWIQVKDVRYFNVQPDGPPMASQMQINADYIAWIIPVQ